MSSLPPPRSSEPEVTAPIADSYGQLFLRFLRFGALAWGGPVAQIDMIRQELVNEQKWVTPDHFKRLLAIYQVLPGPEAHELCVHFGILARGRWGGILAGLGFMLPGFLLIFLLSWMYLTLGLGQTSFQAVFLGIQPAVIALIVRACHRLGTHCLTDTPLWVIGVLAALGDALGISFYITLLLGGLAYLAASRRRWAVASALAAIFVLAAWFTPPALRVPPAAGQVETVSREGTHRAGQASPVQLFGSGLRTGLLTFGGAYTAIPFLRNDAVEKGRWMTERDFLDGIALTGILPAPLIIFSTFVGYFGGGAVGAIVMTVGVFLPAFGFSLLFYRRLESVVSVSWLRPFLEGVTAGVVGLIAATTIKLALPAIPNLPAFLIFAGALGALHTWKSKLATPAIILSAGVIGWLLR